MEEHPPPGEGDAYWDASTGTGYRYSDGAWVADPAMIGMWVRVSESDDLDW